MILAVDVDYRDGFAVAAGVLFNDWPDAEPVQEVTPSLHNSSRYRLAVGQGAYPHDGRGLQDASVAQKSGSTV